MSNAAPGVLQTIEIGILYRQLSVIDRSPYIAMRTKIAEAVCEVVAFNALSAVSTRPALAAVPVIEATVPARIGALWSEKRPID
jgi:hypothetical protein